MLSYDNIRRVHLEISTRCNAACPACPRNLCGVDVVDTYPLVDLHLEQAQKIFSKDFLSQLDQIYINGNYGDFVTAKDGVEVVEYFRASNPDLDIVISTNASAKPQAWEQLARLGAVVKFRIDGLVNTHYLYRQNTDWEFIISNAKKFIAAGGVAHWTMIVFDHNRRQIDDCRQLSKQLGFTKFELVDQGRNTFPVFNKDRQLTHIIGDYRDTVDFDEIYQRYKEADFNFALKVPLTKKTIKCQAKIRNEIYVAANGDVYPCCWLGFYPAHGLTYPSNIQLREIVNKNNALEYDMKTAIEWFNQVEQTWQQDRPIYACHETCGHE